MAFFAGEFAAPAAATSLFTLLGLNADRQKAGELRIQYADGAANQLVIGSSSAVTLAANRGAELSVGEVFQMGSDTNTKIDLTQVFIIGTVAGANIAFVSFVY